MILPSKDGPDMTMQPVPTDDEVAHCGTVALHFGVIPDWPGSEIASADRSGESDKSG